MTHIYYKGGYKYQLMEDYSVDTAFRLADDIASEFIVLTRKGRLTIKRGYAWDGPTGALFNSPDFMRGPLVHDALYQLMREQLMDCKVCRQPADELLRLICREDGMGRARARWIYWVVRVLAESAAEPVSCRPILKAP